MKDTELSYIAGLVDGEGSISISKPTNSNNSFTLEVTVTNKDKQVISWLKESFGGGIRVKYKPEEKFYWSDCYGWKISAQKGLVFLKKILPFLRIKKRQAELAIEFQESIRYMSGKLVPTNTLNVRYGMWKSMIKLNGRGLKAIKNGSAPSLPGTPKM